MGFLWSSSLIPKNPSVPPLGYGSGGSTRHAALSVALSTYTHYLHPIHEDVNVRLDKLLLLDLLYRYEGASDED